METKQKTIRFMAVLLVFAGLIALAITASAGNLEPSAPPASTMKTLDEVEPRIPIPASASPAGTFTISQSGSYYLTGDRLCSGIGIQVDVNDVTIDLMGYTIVGPDTGTNYGIYMNDRRNVEIRNGTVRDFGYSAIYESNSNGKEHRVIGVRTISNGRGIILNGNGHLIKECTATDNSTDHGIQVGYGSTVTGTTAYRNQSYGIFLNGHSCTATGNTVYNNQERGIYAISYGNIITGNTANNNQGYGIYAGYSSTVTGNTAYNNLWQGIYAGIACTITGNTVTSNNQSDNAAGAGIRVGSDCLVKGNTLQGNLQNNIYVYSSGNAIEENLVTGSTGNGIYFNVTGNFYANNRASGNSPNYGGTLPSGGGDGGGNASF